MDLFKTLAAAFNPNEERKRFAECVLLSVSEIGQQIIEDVEKQFVYGKYQVENVLEFPETYPFTLYCEWKASFDYEDGKTSARLTGFELRLHGEVEGEEIKLSINQNTLLKYVLKELTKDQNHDY